MTMVLWKGWAPHQGAVAPHGVLSMVVHVACFCFPIRCYTFVERVQSKMIFWVRGTFISLSGSQCAPMSLLLFNPSADTKADVHWQSLLGLKDLSQEIFC